MSYSPDDPTPISVLVAPSPVGSISADDVAQYLAEGVRQIILDADIRLSPLSTEPSSTLVDGQHITLPTTTPAGNLTEATYVLDGTTAYIDAPANDSPTPGTSDSYGLGVLVADAQSRGARRVVLFLNGATADDGGVGILVALGANPLDQSGRTLPKGGKALEALADFETAQLNVGAAAMEWVFVGGSTEDAPGIPRLAEVTGVDPETPNLAIALTWLSALLHGEPQVRIVSGAEFIDVEDLANPGDFIISSGPAALAFARDTDNTVATITDDVEATPEALRQAGAQLAADYLRISTVQG